MSQNIKFVRFLSWNAVNFATLAIVSLASLPVYYGKLSSANFAIISIIWSTLAISTVLDLGIGRALTREIGAITNESEIKNYKSVASSGIAVAGFYSALAASIVQFGIATYFEQSSNDYKIEQQTTILIALTVFATLAGNAFLAVYEGMHLIRLVTVIKMFFTISFMAGPAALIALSTISKLNDIVWVIFLTRVTQLVICFAIALKLKAISLGAISYGQVKALLSKGKWLTLSSMVSIGMINSDRFIIGHYRSPIDLGAYVIASELIQRGVGILSIIPASLYPLISRTRSLAIHGHYRRTAFLLSSIIGIIGIGLGFLLINQFLTIWLGKDDILQIAHLFQIMLIGWLASGFGQLYLANIHSAGDTRTPALIHTVEAILVIPIMIYAIYAHGAYGAAVVWTVRAVGDALILKFFSGRI